MAGLASPVWWMKTGPSHCDSEHDEILAPNSFIPRHSSIGGGQWCETTFMNYRYEAEWLGPGPWEQRKNGTGFGWQMRRCPCCPAGWWCSHRLMIGCWIKQVLCRSSSLAVKRQAVMRCWRLLMEADGKSDVFLKYFWKNDPLQGALKTLEHQ